MQEVKLTSAYGKKLLLFRNVFAFCAVILMFVIFKFSSQNGSSSSKTSGEFIYKLSEFFIGNFSYEKKLALINSLQFFVRKSAHFFVYFVLGVFVFGFFSTYSFKTKISVAVSFIVCLLYSVSDEIHQLLVFERSGEFRDVLIDTSGSVFGIMIFYLILSKILRRKCFGQEKNFC